MALQYQQALGVGATRVSAWSALLDQINVFPLADADTGRNLVVTLSPLRRMEGDVKKICRDLLFSARGNSGNIAARFFHEFIQTDSLEHLPSALRKGRDQAWLAVKDPRPGTMLSFFDALADSCREAPGEATPLWVHNVLEHAGKAVRETAEIQPVLKKAGVLDAGALGMFLFFDGFLNALAGCPDAFRPLPALFEPKLTIAPSFQHEVRSGFCVDAVVRKRRGRKEACEALSSSEESVVVMGDGEYVKVHLHTRDRESTRKGLAASGDILQWSDDNLETQTAAFQGLLKQQAIHIMTDAAGSLTREDAQKRGITLLDSYITVGGTSLPETCFAPSEIYAAMRKGIRVTTSQASDAERHHWYQQALSLSKQVLYLCVGSGFTGNHTAALQWKNNFDPDNRMLVMDTQAASGSLGVLAITTAQHAKGNAQPHEVVAFAREAAGRCGEYIFIDTLKYLAAGGRLSTTGAFFGDMLHMKPVISPGAGGAKKVGVVRNSEDQIRFALQKLAKALSPDGSPLIMLEYSDNREWVESRAAQEVQKRYPSAEMLIKPLSLTTGVHTGPGTWAVAYVAEKGRSA